MPITKVKAAPIDSLIEMLELAKDKGAKTIIFELFEKDGERRWIGLADPNAKTNHIGMRFNNEGKNVVITCYPETEVE